MAVPNVTVVPADSGCSAYPGYDPASGTSAPFMLQAVQADNSTVNGLGTSFQYSRGATQIRWGSISLGTRIDEAKVQLKCYNNTLHGFVSTGVSSFTWEVLKFSPYPYDAELMYLVDGGPDAQLYSHYIGGAKQDGVFIGAQGVTTWGFEYYDGASGCCGAPFYELRLLGPKSADPSTGAALRDGEFRGFLKVVSF